MKLLNLTWIGLSVALAGCSISAEISKLGSEISPEFARNSMAVDVVSASKQGEVTSAGYVVSASMDMQSGAFFSKTTGQYRTWSSVQASLETE